MIDMCGKEVHLMCLECGWTEITQDTFIRSKCPYCHSDGLRVNFIKAKGKG